MQLLIKALQASAAGGYVTNSALTGDAGMRSLAALEPLRERFLAEHGPTIPAPYSNKWPVDKLHWWSRPEEYSFTLFHLLSLLRQAPVPVRILEFGPGCSFVPHVLTCACGLSKIRMQGIDPNVLAFWKAVGPRIGLQVESHDLAEPHELDIIYSVSVVEHVQNPEVTVNDLVRQLAPGGTLFLTMDVDLNREGHYGLTAIQLANILSIEGMAFESVHCRAACPHPLDIATPRNGWRIAPLKSATPGQRIAPSRRPLSSLKQAIRQLGPKRSDPHDICAVRLIGHKAQ